MEILMLSGFAIVAAVICLLIRQYKPEYAVAIELVCGVLILGVIMVQMSPVLSVIRELLGKLDIANEYVIIIVKALGICYITQLACDTCRDAGQTAIATKIELAGKVAIVLLSLPMFTQLLDIALSFLTI